MLFAVDCEKGEGPELAKQYGVPGYPTFVMLNPGGAITASWLGYDGPESFAGKVNAGLADPRPVADKAAAFAASPDLALALQLADHAAASNDLSASVTYLKKARELDAAGYADYSSQILQTMFWGARSEKFTLAEVAAEAEPVQSMAQLGGMHAEVMQIGVQMAGLAVRSGEPDVATPFLERAMASLAATPAESRPSYAGRIEVAHALIVEKDADKALRLKRAGLPEGWRDDPSELNSFAWWCFENGVNLEEALELAMRGVELAGSDSDRAEILDTAAEICHALGECDDAIAKIREAIALNPGRDYYQRQLAKFEAAKAADGC